jgi:hypothetical protein
MPAQLARADVQHGVAEPCQEGRALLLPLALIRLRQQLDDERALPADVGGDERTYLTARAEAMRIQGARLQQPAQPVFSGAIRLRPRPARSGEEGSEHERRLALRVLEAGGDYLGECREIVRFADQRQSWREVTDHSRQTEAGLVTNAPTRRCPRPRCMQRGSCAHCTA